MGLFGQIANSRLGVKNTIEGRLGFKSVNVNVNVGLARQNLSYYVSLDFDHPTLNSQLTVRIQWFLSLYDRENFTLSQETHETITELEIKVF